MRRRKIALIGAGNIGGELANRIVSSHMGDVVLLDLNSGVAAGKALDLTHGKALSKSDCKIFGGSDYTSLDGVDAIIVTAGIARKPGMTREDLLSVNEKVMREIGENIKKYTKEPLVIVITNPLDVMAMVMYKSSGLPSNKVVGMAGILDSSRFESLLAETINVSVENVHACVLGGHGDQMLPLPRYSSIAGIPLTKIIEMGMLSKEQLNKIVERTKNSGAEVVELMKTSSAFYSPAHSALCMLDAYFNDKKQILACSAYVTGQYGLKSIFIGVPCIIGGNGVEKIIDLELTDEESKIFKNSADAIQNMLRSLNL